MRRTKKKNSAYSYEMKGVNMKSIFNLNLVWIRLLYFKMNQNFNLIGYNKGKEKK